MLAGSGDGVFLDKHLTSEEGSEVLNLAHCLETKIKKVVVVARAVSGAITHLLYWIYRIWVKLPVTEVVVL